MTAAAIEPSEPGGSPPGFPGRRYYKIFYAKGEMCIRDRVYLVGLYDLLKKVSISSSNPINLSVKISNLSLCMQMTAMINANANPI